MGRWIVEIKEVSGNLHSLTYILNEMLKSRYVTTCVCMYQQSKRWADLYLDLDLDLDLVLVLVLDFGFESYSLYPWMNSFASTNKKRRVPGCSSDACVPVN